MAENSKIEWTDHSASPWYGCSKVHTGCDHCYAEAMSKRNPGTLGVWGDDGTRIKSKSFSDNLEKWNRLGEKEQRIQSVFPSLCDPFEDRPELEPWRREMFELIDRLPWVRLLLLTKRPENILKMWPQDGAPPALPHRHQHGDLLAKAQNHYRFNVSLYYSASDQESLEAGIGDLLKCRDLVPVRGLSLEPLVGPIDAIPFMGGSSYRCRCRWHRTENEMCMIGGGYICFDCGKECVPGATVDHVIIGGESGPGARHCCLEYVDDLRRQCAETETPCFIKQLGSRPVTSNANIWDVPHPGKFFGASWGPSAAGCSINLENKKGGDWSEWPEDLRVREQPETAGEVA